MEPGADVAAVTTMQVREVIERLVAAGQWRPGDPKVLVVLKRRGLTPTTVVVDTSTKGEPQTPYTTPELRHMRLTLCRSPCTFGELISEIRC